VTSLATPPLLKVALDLGGSSEPERWVSPCE
jgi:hypothetical protein